MSRMFEINGKRMTTWQAHVGCQYGCTYCSVRKLVQGRLKNVPRYKGGFEDCHIVESELSKRFKPGEFVFVNYMGDIRWTLREDMDRIYMAMLNSPDTHFLLMSKNPGIFLVWQEQWGYTYKSEWYLGTTIETNRRELIMPLSKAPEPQTRYADMAGISHPCKLVSIEPVMDFDYEVMVHWIRTIQPQIVFIGADNYGNGLVEPPWHKVQSLINELKKTVPAVIEKSGLERLKDQE